jgi:L-fuconolactonase
MLSAAAAATAAELAHAAAGPVPIIDTHLHLYDPRRPSPWIKDNLWILEIIKNEPIIVGTVGNIDPTKPEFRQYLDRYHRNKLFLGIRYGNIWEGDSLGTALDSPEFIANMKAFAETGLTLEVANPRFDLTEATVRLTDKVPQLRVVLGHLQQLPLPSDKAVLKSYSANLKELRSRNVFAKVSGLPKPDGGQSPWDPASYKPMFDFIWDIFGEDYIVFAAGWSRMRPQPGQPQPIERMKNNLKAFRTYLSPKGRPAAEKFFWKNSIAAFRWVERSAQQQART